MGTPMWFAVYIEGLISSSKLRDGSATFVSSCRLLFSDKEEPKMYPIWHQMLKFASSSGTPPQTQLRSLRCSLYFLPSRNSQSQLGAFSACSYPTRTLKYASLLVARGCMDVKRNSCNGWGKV